MITVQVIFKNPLYNYYTQINTDLESAKKYFLNKSFNFGDTEETPFDDMQTCIEVKEIL
jgi:hypothetical protein